MPVDDSSCWAGADLQRLAVLSALAALSSLQ
jgi:hypothetical protein